MAEQEEDERSNGAGKVSPGRNKPPRPDENGHSTSKKPSRQQDQKDDQEQDDEQSPEEKKRQEQKSHKRKWIALILLIVVLVIALIVVIPWWLNARQFESTDDAFVDAHWEKIAPRVAGRVLKINYDDNAFVEQGATILQLDPSDFQVNLEQQTAGLAQAAGKLSQAKAQELVANAGVGQAQADVDRTQVNRDNAQIELQRYEGLSAEAVSAQRLDDLRANLRTNDAQLSSARKSLDAAKAQVVLAQSQIVAANAGVQTAQAKVDSAKLQLSYCDVKALTSGKVTQRGVREGDYVSVGQQMLELVPSQVWVTANYKETQLTHMRVGQRVEIEVDAYPDHKLHGKVQSIQAGTGAWFSLLPPENATGNYVKVVQRVPVKITIDDQDDDLYKLLTPGMSIVPYVKVRD